MLPDRKRLKERQMGSKFTIPGMTEKQGRQVADLLQKQLSTYNDLHLTLKHVHWNVVGPNFIGVHEMIDPQVELVRGYADDVAERIATLGHSPQGTPGDHQGPHLGRLLGRPRHRAGPPGRAGSGLRRGDRDVRKGIATAEELDPVTQDLLIGQAAELEKFQWFVRAHLENAGGALSHEGASTEKQAARKAR